MSAFVGSRLMSPAEMGIDPFPFKREMAWHYTHASNANAIIEQQLLRPIAGGWSDARPGLFFTTQTNPEAWTTYVSHQLRNMQDDAGELPMACLQWVRFGYDGADMIPAATLPFLFDRNPAAPSDESRFIDGERIDYADGRYSKLDRAHARTWRVLFRPLHLVEVSAIEMTNDGGHTWHTIGTPLKDAGGIRRAQLARNLMYAIQRSGHAGA